MKSAHSYRERDYAFGQMMLTLRTSIGLTQAGLGERLRVSRRAVVEWEGGLSYPKVDSLKRFIALYGGTVCQDSFWAKIRQNSTVRETHSSLFRYTCAGV